MSPPDSPRERAWWFALATIAFGTSYALLPLYSSNQNHHFLIGIARAGEGMLREDWLVSTRDPFPVFTAFVWFVHRYLSDALHYVVYYLLLGAYAYGLIGIVEHVMPGGTDKTSDRLLFLAAICVLHNEVIGYLLGFRLAHMPWWQMTHWGVAEQELFGHGAFQASSFGLLLPLALRWFLEHRSRLATAAVGCVLLVHASYALTAGALVLGFVLVERRRSSGTRVPLEIMAIFLAFVLPAIGYVAIAFSPTSAEISRQAAAILAHHLPQETNPAVWFGVKAWLQIVVIAVGIALASRSDLFAPLLAVFVAGAVATAVQVLTGSEQLALLFPWRGSVLLVPIATALLIRLGVRSRFFPRHRLRKKSRSDPVVAWALIALSMIASGVRMVLNFAYYDDVRPLATRLDAVVPSALRADFARAMRPETLPMMDFARRTLAAGDLYVIPPELERFRLRSGAPAFADSKSHPYKDREVLEWNARLTLARAFYDTRSCAALDAMRTRYGVTHVVLDERVRGVHCDGFERIYADPVFDVYRVTRR